MTEQNINRYPLEMYTKYRLTDCSVPQELQPYLTTEVLTKNSSLLVPEIRAYLGSYMLKKNLSTKDEDIYETLQGLLNKLSNNNFNDVYNEVKQISYSETKHIYKLAESIILKSINDQKMADIYSQLCKKLLNLMIVDDGKKVYFKTVLILICQDLFEEILCIRRVGKLYDYTRSTDYSKLSLAGLMKFIGECYNNDVINEKIIDNCFNVMFSLLLEGKNHYDGLNVLVKTVLNKLKDNCQTLFNKFKHLLESLISSDTTNKQFTFNDKEITFKFSMKLYKFKIIELIEEYNKLDKKN